jgi:soluble lytic murein transglycosylase-like protein
VIFSKRYDSLFEHYSTTRLPWKLLKAQACIESSLDPNVVNSSSGCKGLSQFADATFKEVVGKMKLKNASIWNPEHAIAAQAFYMTELLTLFGSIDKALAAYNWGMGNMMKIYKKSGWFVMVPPETKKYVQDITELVKVV